MSEIRQSAVAGSFYPADPVQLQTDVDQLLASIEPENTPFKAVIAPHAGYVYSGPTAASIYAELKFVRSKVTRVVLLGPSHSVGFKGIAACTSRAYQTPLGPVSIDKAALKSIIGLPNVGYLDDAHLHEHSLEVHLPFLQRSLKQFELVPLVVGNTTKRDVARVIDKLWGGPETLIVISSDLSHYHSYGKAQQIDTATSKKVLKLQTDISAGEACGHHPINGLLHLAKKKRLTVQQIDVRNSGDTAGTHDRVVGYGAFSLTEKAPSLKRKVVVGRDPQMFSIALRQQILQVARQAILQPLQNKENFHINLSQFPTQVKDKGASFITINLNGRLRGCIGSLEAHQPLILDVANNAQAAAFKDPRFTPLSLQEYQTIELHASILSPPEALSVNSHAGLLSVIRPGKDGIIIEESGKRATYLPSVWSQLPDPDRFISELRMKAGLDPNKWGQAKVFRYTTEEFN